MKLYFDIGNTNIKLNFIEDSLNNYVSYSTNLSYTVDLIYSYLPKKVKEHQVKKIVICSVVPHLTPIFEGLSKKYFGIKPLIISKKLKLGLSFDVDNPLSVGSDLISLSIFSKTKGNNVLIVNMGTSTTISHIKNSTFKGAIIIPGIGMQIESVSKKLSQIGEVSISLPKKHIGKNTKDALSLGIIHSHVYAIKKHIENIDKNAKIILSGGHHKKITHLVNYECVKEATIQGMKEIEILNNK